MALHDNMDAIKQDYHNLKAMGHADFAEASFAQKAAVTVTGLLAAADLPFHETYLGLTGGHVFSATHSVLDTGVANGALSFGLEGLIATGIAVSVNAAPNVTRYIGQRLLRSKKTEVDTTLLSSGQSLDAVHNTLDPTKQIGESPVKPSEPKQIAAGNKIARLLSRTRKISSPSLKAVAPLLDDASFLISYGAGPMQFKKHDQLPVEKRGAVREIPTAIKSAAFLGATNGLVASGIAKLVLVGYEHPDYAPIARGTVRWSKNELTYIGIILARVGSKKLIQAKKNRKLRDKEYQLGEVINMHSTDAINVESSAIDILDTLPMPNVKTSLITEPILSKETLS